MKLCKNGLHDKDVVGTIIDRGSNLCLECRKASQKRGQRKYWESETRKAYRKSERWKEAQERYEKSEKRKQGKKLYHNSEKGKTKKKAYSKSEAGKKTQNRYNRSTKGRAKSRRHYIRNAQQRNEYSKRWAQSHPEARKESNRRLQERRRLAGGKMASFWQNQAKESL